MSVGFIGVGSMGQGIALNMLGAEKAMTVFDVNEAAAAPLLERQARLAASPRDVADREALVFGCLPSNPAFEAVVGGADGVVHGKAIKVFVNLGTVGRPTLLRAAETLGAKGIAVVDAPISGGSPRARAGTLTIMAAGPKAAYEQVRPMLEAASSKLVYLGEKPGVAQTMKLVNNIVSVTNLAVACEAMVMGAKAGLDPETMLEVLNTGSGQNSATLTKVPDHILTREFDYGSGLYIIRKDMTLWQEEAEELGVPMSVALSARQLFMTAYARFGQNADMSEVIRLVEELAGFEVPKTR
ncbi:MAG: NAD(P)-dependent oxidoreductase [Alphaproteobacteria bacterium]